MFDVWCVKGRECALLKLHLFLLDWCLGWVAGSRQNSYLGRGEREREMWCGEGGRAGGRSFTWHRPAGLSHQPLRIRVRERHSDHTSPRGGESNWEIFLQTECT